MADYLVIVESPAKAKTIGKYLGKRYAVKASMGHVRDLPKSQLGVDVEHDYQPKYITIRGKGDVIKALRSASKKAKKVYLAADPDREGEAIAWHLQHILDLNPDDSCRVVFHEITKDAIKNAFKNPRKINMDVVNAQQTRRILDRLVGYRLSPLLWRKVRKGLSAGRVQSVAVRLIVDRENEIRKFQPEEYWTVDVTSLVDGKKLTSRFYGYDEQKTPLPNEEAVNELLARIGNDALTVRKVKKSERRRNPAAPFITSSLQQEAARKLGFRAYKTMAVAQQLYEGLDIPGEGTVGLITYMRTDSTRIAQSAQEEARDYIRREFGAEYVPSQPRQYSKNEDAQDAHEGIRPTSTLRHPDLIKDHLSKDQYRLYKLIWERFVASQMSSAVLDTTSVDSEVNGAWFRATGSVIKFPGFMAVYIEGNDDQDDDDKSRLLPPVSEGQVLKTQKVTPEQHFTQPPPRYSESSLVKAMEELGIGRPSTYAPTIDTILKRGYVVLEQKRFVPTELGEIVVELLVENFKQLIDVDFTANLEGELDAVEDGEADWVKLLDEFYHAFEKDLEHAESSLEHVEIKDEESDVPCDKCGRMMVYKNGRYGKFLACPGFPECRNTKPITKEVGVNCPKCDKPLVERRGKRRKVFYGCSGYPECDYVLWQKPTGQLCPICSHPLVEKQSRGKVTVVCSNEKAHPHAAPLEEESKRKSS
ncbi:type I DNA topoisomerase [Alicyclobacillus acidoterrestris]|uniref:DNA topoisomerase 1 n=1 Tax=Alicyclobacillus acidoterrestris (strain ATCC 49025 / DSM 3922 / CIP 106132 / NCIMB 13137 / GD3B) TaxID=1356854 RepID=T0BQH4_ALIAG|nr:type I DNA topoisomerase [Alicyclobacillus acidoterrestris]EPZ46273.1 DNA topoisomerase I [Alicyclobacillus acidoterrestris ATCC 49025]UNO47098.1 type I DNA topoisomerase [Alicyclobacillus acidoterrestris]